MSTLYGAGAIKVSHRWPHALLRLVICPHITPLTVCNLGERPRPLSAPASQLVHPAIHLTISRAGKVVLRPGRPFCVPNKNVRDVGLVATFLVRDGLALQGDGGRCSLAPPQANTYNFQKKNVSLFYNKPSIWETQIRSHVHIQFCSRPYVSAITIGKRKYSKTASALNNGSLVKSKHARADIQGASIL